MHGGETPDPNATPRRLNWLGLLRELEQLPIRPTGDGSRHDLANRWGPLRLWLGAQLLRPTDERLPNPDWVRTLREELRGEEAYAYLLGLASLREKLNASDYAESHADVEEVYEMWVAFLSKYEGPPIQVLLLDDEIDKGWGEAVKVLLETSSKIEVDTSLSGADFDRNTAHIEDHVMEQTWDLVLGDLRTSSEDQNAAPNRDIMSLSGAQLIHQLKEERPQTAVIAFTASNKAWSVQKLSEVGIDGYWTKESPEFGVSQAYTRDNTASLLDTGRRVLQRRIEARPVGQLWSDFETLCDEPAYQAGWADSLGRDESQTAPRLEAIAERLARAYGFLVMDRSEFAERHFAMRRCDLAFLTLWSILNEAVELFLDDPRANRHSKYNKDLVEWGDAEFAIRHPSGGHRHVYWHLTNGHERVAPSGIPPNLVSLLCPGSSADEQRDTPKWPRGAGFDNALVGWLLHETGEAEWARRFGKYRHKGNYGLRVLRNKLSHAHGRRGDQAEATVDDVTDLCQVWRLLLVSPYS